MSDKHSSMVELLATAFLYLAREASEKSSQEIAYTLELQPHMNDIARLYSCLRCHSQVTICRYCDRGNVYCSECAPKARQEAKTRASTRYQASEQGRSNHAARQRLYRERMKQKVTHKGVFGSRDQELLANRQKNTNLPAIQPKSAMDTSIYCRSCRRLCSPFLRRDFLHSTA